MEHSKPGRQPKRQGKVAPNPLSSPLSTPALAVPSMKELLGAFLKIGFLTVGGGIAMVGVMRHELVDRRRWIQEFEFNDMLAFSASVPGALSVNLGFLVGQRFYKWPGAMLSAACVVVPAYLIILLVVAFFESFLSHPLVLKFFNGAAGAVAAQIVYSTIRFSAATVRDIVTVLVGAVGLAIILIAQVHPLLVVLGAFVVRVLIPISLPKPGDPPAPPEPQKDNADV